MKRDNNMMYYIKNGDVWAVPRKKPGQPKGKASKVVAAGIDMDYGKYLYFLDSDGDVTATLWGSPAFNAGIVKGARIIAVNSLAYSADGMRQAISRAKTGGQPIELLIRRGDRFMTVSVPYSGGLRWPWLERVGSGEAPLDRLLAARRSPTRQ